MELIEKYTANGVDDAELFVMKLKESRVFCDSVCGLSSRADLQKVLENCGFKFDTYLLTKALAEYINREVENNAQEALPKIDECLLELL